MTYDFSSITPITWVPPDPIMRGSDYSFSLRFYEEPEKITRISLVGCEIAMVVKDRDTKVVLTSATVTYPNGKVLGEVKFFFSRAKTVLLRDISAYDITLTTPDDLKVYLAKGTLPSQESCS